MADIVERLREVQCDTEFDAATCDMAADEITRLRAALEELIWYTNQLELDVYDPSEWPNDNSAVKNARAALQQEPQS